MKRIVHVVGARPNFMKAAPVIIAVRASAHCSQRLINTGQHYDDAMARTFFTELQLPTPDRDLGVGSGSHASQTAAVMTGFEDVCRDERPDLVVVYGDINSTMAATLVAAKLRIPVAHVEAGLRSFDRSMPEEINRIVTDRLASLLLTPSFDANDNLRAEGVPPERVRLVGNVMIDTLLRFLPRATLDRVRPLVSVEAGRFAVVTLHRPSNVDVESKLRELLDVIRTVSGRMPVVFSVHPRTRARLREFGLDESSGNIQMTEPMGYLDFLSLTSHAAIVLTDSGGLQEETTALGVPCLTLRENTERPVTVTEGTNHVVGTHGPDILRTFETVLATPPVLRRPQLWDGHAGERVAAAITSMS
jgi:UDP-N-acetylglucosamine 2-epimerase (non-hydrolysing)